MSSALHIARTGLDAQELKMRVVANNLANVNTVGFKRDRAKFETLLYQNLRQAGAQSSQGTQLATGLTIGTGTRVAGTERIFNQGSMINTGNSLDLALDGPGFFQILMPDGTTSYTRDGAFNMAPDGSLVSAAGYQLQPGMVIPPNAQSITIGSDGTLTVTLPLSNDPVPVGQIVLANFLNPAGLLPEGENFFKETAASGVATEGVPDANGYGRVVQGSLEASNVNVVEELVNMIETQRAYEVNSKAISSVDGMLRYVNQNM